MMKRSLLIIIPLICLMIKASAEKEDNHPLMYSENCGEVLQTSYGGKISYKPGEVVGNYEGCMWLLRFDSSDRINFTLVEGSYPEEFDNVNIVTFLRTDDSIGLNTYFSMFKEPGSTSMQGSAALVTFGTYGGRGDVPVEPKYGFVLEFYGNLAPIPPKLSSRSMNLINIASLKTLNGTLTLPERGVVHDSGELSLIVFPPPDFSYSPNNPLNSLWFDAKGQDCNRKLAIYSYSMTRPPMLWERLCASKSYNCGSVVSSFFFLAFYSEESNANDGDAFQVSWNMRLQSL